MAQTKQPKARQVHHLWPWSKKTAVFPGGSYRIAWDEAQQAWTVQFPKIVYLLHTQGQRNLQGEDDDVDLYHEDDSLFQRARSNPPLFE